MNFTTACDGPLRGSANSSRKPPVRARNVLASFPPGFRLLPVHTPTSEVHAPDLKEIAMNRKALICSTAVAATLWCGAAQAVPQAFVKSDGDDGNTGAGCPVVSPCRTFAAALTVVNDGGDLIALDTEDFGPVTIKQSVSIIGNGRAGIVVSTFGAAAIDIVKPDVNVVLRGLTLNGSGVGGSGVYMKEGKSLQIENCIFSNFSINGLLVITPASVRIVDSVMRGNGNGIGARIEGGARADIIRSQFLGNRGGGLLVYATTAGTTSAAVSDSVASGNGLEGFSVAADNKFGLGRMVVTGSTAAHNGRAGFLASASVGNAVMTVGRSTSAHNAYGLAQFPGVSGTSSLETMGDNSVRHNTTPTVGVIVSVAPM